MVKIISGWSDRGGSTFAFINLTNKLNESGIDTTFYGPHPWHLDKCKSGLLDEKFRLSQFSVLNKELSFFLDSNKVSIF